MTENIALGELKEHISEATSGLNNGPAVDALCRMIAPALETLDLLAPLIHDDNENVEALLKDTREELLDCCLAVAAGREKLAYVMLRGVMEGLFTALLYREQGMSVILWARGSSFVMAHQLLETKDSNEFFMYYKPLFDDDGYKTKFPGVNAKRVFEEGNRIYKFLSSYIHKKKTRAKLTPKGDKQTLPEEFHENLAIVFRVFLTFLERTEELPAGISFPSPATWPESVCGK